MLRLLGILGALDPHQYQALTAKSTPSSGTAGSRFQVRSSGSWGAGEDNPTEGFDDHKLFSDGRLGRPVRFYQMNQIAKRQRQAAKFKTWVQTTEEGDSSGDNASSSDKDSLESRSSGSDDSDESERIDVFSRYTMGALLHLLSDPTQNATTRSVGTQALISILQHIGTRCVVFSSIALPALLNLVANSPDTAERTRLLTYMAQLISVSRNFAQPFLDQIVGILANLLDNLIRAVQAASAIRSPSGISR